jgi:hypothetical protein
MGKILMPLRVVEKSENIMAHDALIPALTYRKSSKLRSAKINEIAQNSL